MRFERRPATSDPGLVLIQIDGLSMTQFNRALEKGRMPFLSKLLRKERYVAHAFYSGLPSNTPAVQGELFYGVKTCVPAFSYMDRATGRVFRMFDSDCAQAVEKRLAAEGRPLLKGGSAYSNIFTGGADEAHFCAAKIGWGGVGHAVNPFVFPLLFLCYLDIFIRSIALMVLELVISTYEFVRHSLVHRKLMVEEFQFIAARVFASVLLRELVVAGSCMDLARGLPVIHANFIGYDEQSHRRGPSSAFAHWSLQGIDDAVRRVWEMAGKSGMREYEVWIYSDHGQEKTASYVARHGRTLREAVEEVAGARSSPEPFGARSSRRSSADWRIGEMVHESMRDRQEAALTGSDAVRGASGITVAAMGPIGHIYFPESSEEKCSALAERLTREAGVPLVLRRSRGGARAWTSEGTFELPKQAAAIFGEDHPFFEEAAKDLLELCRHPDAGELIVAGWRKGVAPSTFPLESGAHAGLGAEETRGFAFLPLDAPLAPKHENYLRPLDVREAALKILDRGADTPFTLLRRRVCVPKTLRIMTYNVHGCVGMDGQMSTDRIARVIARYEPDLIALQELDSGRARSGGVDQAERIARRLEMAFHFQPAYRLKDGAYGNAVLGRHPMAIVKMGPLPRLRETPDCEPRGAIWVCAEVEGMKIHLINTHLSIWPTERRLQAEALAGSEWLGHPDCAGTVILAGDLNCGPGSPPHRALGRRLKNSLMSGKPRMPVKTWYAGRPTHHLDHIFVSSELEALSVTVPGSRLETIASDHLPMIVEIKINC